ncbi:MAG: AAA family ATPase [Treponema sp.]|nr:AAA family ATPase [Treponema sp.]
MSLRSILSANRLSIGKAAHALGVDKSTVSKVCSQTYPGWEQKEKDFIKTLNERGYSKIVPDQFDVDTDVLVPTRSVDAFINLADDLADPGGSRCSSLGMVIGTAERGKTHTARWYVDTHPDACYVLYIEMSTRVQFLRDICESLANIRPLTFGACLALIHESCSRRSRLIIIDEADKLPVPFLELLRGINERCSVPILLAGEEGLKSKIDGVPRLRSRVRKPVVLYESLNAIDVAVFYSNACGIEIDRDIADALVKRSRGAWRSLVNDTLALARMGRASGIATVTPEMIEKLG